MNSWLDLLNKEQ